MNPLAKNNQKSPFDPLLYAWKSIIIDRIYDIIFGNKDAASHIRGF
tara:strand:+ start:277 stop:414 length:138 start_codon:yes stop_codon:yes gene_type:complete